MRLCCEHPRLSRVGAQAVCKPMSKTYLDGKRIETLTFCLSGEQPEMSKVRIGIIGAGWWAAENHIPVLQSWDDVEVAAACSLGKDNLERLKSRFAIPFVTEDYKQLVTHSRLDGVVISSPHHLHFEHCLSALEQPLHVLCEKPMTLRSVEARQLVDAVESSKSQFLIPYGWNYTDFAATAKEKIRQGMIGNIRHVHCHMASADLEDLFSGEEASFAKEALFRPQKRTWSDPLIGGGFAHGQLSHALGLLLWITDLEAGEVIALMGRSETGADLFNSMSCRFKNGATGTLGGAATMPPDSPYQVDIRIFGTQGILLLDIERPRLEIRRNDGQHFSMPMTHEPGAYSCVEPLRVFVDLIKGAAAENRSPVRLGAQVVEILDAAFRSIDSRTLETV
jgi:predicted dehydrogenase